MQLTWGFQVCKCHFSLVGVSGGVGGGVGVYFFGWLIQPFSLGEFCAGGSAKTRKERLRMVTFQHSGECWKMPPTTYRVKSLVQGSGGVVENQILIIP